MFLPGLRSPRHTWMSSITYRTLNPIAAAPIRPGETIVGYRVEVDAYLTQMVKLPWMPPIDYEIGLWAIPLGAYPDYFKDFMVADPEDQGELFPTLSGSGADVTVGVNLQGPHNQTPIQYENRPWAGEIAVSGTVEPADLQAAYAAWVSTGTYVVARNYYEMEVGSNPAGNLARDSPDLYNSPPSLGHHIRSPLGSMIPLGQFEDTIGTPGTAGTFANSISELAERLSLMTQTNRTYKEYLEGWGIDPSRVQSLPEPLMLTRRRMRGNPSSVSVPTTRRTAAGGAQFTDQYGRIERQAQGIATEWYDADGGGIGLVSTSLDRTFKRRFTAVEPTVLLLTHCWWYYAFPGSAQNDTRASRHLDMARMTNAAHWGDPAGGMSEVDFLAAQRILKADGIDALVDEDIRTGPFAMNMLNLFLNGGTFTNTGEFEVVPAWSTGQSGSLSGDGSVKVNSMGKLSFSVATDLVR